jgi:SagB-type dehydrogenase family enzyme
MFDPRILPTLGVGVEYHAHSDSPRQAPLCVMKAVDYIEIQPPHLIFDPLLLEALGDVRAVLHSSDLSLGSIGVPMDREFLTLTCRLLKQTRTPWFGEHISWNRFPGGDTRHFVLPFLGDEVRDAVIANARELTRLTGLTVLLENAPRTLVVDVDGDAPEPQFMREVVEGAEAGFILDVDNARATARTCGLDLREYILSLPVERTVEIHVHDPVADRELYWQILEQAPVRALTIGWSARDRAEDGDLQDLLKAAKEHLHRDQNRITVQVLKPSAEPVYRLPSDVALTLSCGKVRLTGGKRGINAEVSPQWLPLLLLLQKPQSLSEVLSASEIPTDSMVSAAPVLGELIRIGGLEPVSPNDDASQGLPPIWSGWDAAYDFYLATRTGRDVSFSSLEETNECLEDRSKSSPAPPAYKDYGAHPFFPLPKPTFQNPGQGSPFLDVLHRRRSIRAFSSEPVTKQELSSLLKHVWGQTDSRPNALGDDFLRKTSPSGGALHGAEVYPILINVEGLPQGLYHYSVRRHGLELISQENPAQWVSMACGDQSWVAEAAALFLTTYKVERLAWKYTFSRGFRAALLEVGHLGQTFGLVATNLELGPLTTIALRDQFLEEKLGLNWRDEPIILMNGVGRIDHKVANPERPRS